LPGSNHRLQAGSYNSHQTASAVTSEIMVRLHDPGWANS
jgi:hypothetical protein